jgi:hypothetical protein
VQAVGIGYIVGIKHTGSFKVIWLGYGMAFVIRRRTTFLEGSRLLHRLVEDRLDSPLG